MEDGSKCKMTANVKGTGVKGGTQDDISVHNGGGICDRLFC